MSDCLPQLIQERALNCSVRCITELHKGEEVVNDEHMFGCCAPPDKIGFAILSLLMRGAWRKIRTIVASHIVLATIFDAVTIAEQSFHFISLERMILSAKLREKPLTC